MFLWNVVYFLYNKIPKCRGCFKGSLKIWISRYNKPMSSPLDPSRGIQYDLYRMERAIALCGNPQQAFRGIHVAGTNGKGSTCAYIESVLRHGGYKTGLYSSPCLFTYEEHFRLDGNIIKEETWKTVRADLEGIISGEGLSSFEATTLLAFEIFRRAGVDAGIIEAGMGGTLDATNVIVPEVSVITKLGLDHCEYLGDTLEKITEHKLGIVKPRVPLVMLDPELPQLRHLARQRCLAQGSDLTLVPVEELDIPTAGSFSWRGKSYQISMAGRHQAENALVALHALEKTGPLEEAVITQGLRAARIPARFQQFSHQGHKVVIDGAHNADGAAALAAALAETFPGKRILMVLGIMKDKDRAAMLARLAPLASVLCFTRPRTERASEPEDLLALVEPGLDRPCIIEGTVEEALERALKESTHDDIICVAGSFYTAAEALSFFKRTYDT